MTLLAPLGLALALTLGVLVLLYLLKIQPQNREVGSIYLWERLLPELAAHQPWQKPRFTPLFFLQALALLALVVAVSRPAVFALAEEPVSTIIILDATASMKAIEGHSDRFAKAREQVALTIRALPEGSTATLIAAGANPIILATETNDQPTLLRALEQASPTDAPGSLAEAIRLAAGLTLNRERARVDVFTDGAVDLPPDLAEVHVPLVWHMVPPAEPMPEQQTVNWGITEFSARADPLNRRKQHLFLRVQQFGGPSVENQVLVMLVAHDAQGEHVLDSRPLTFSPEGLAEVVFDELPEAAPLIEARLRHVPSSVNARSPVDALAADDSASIVLERPQNTRVLLVSRGNLFIEKALSLLPNVQLDRISPRRFGAILPEEYDLLVFDTDVPDLLPNRPLLIVNPAGSALVPVDGYLRRPAIVAWERQHPLLRHVDLTEVRFSRAPQVTAPGWAQAIVESDGGPLLLAGTEQGRRVVIFAFDLQQSNLPLTSAFPILMANTIGYLEPPGVIGDRTISPGAEVKLTPSFDTRTIVVRGPGGEETALEVKEPTITFTDTMQVGHYRVLQRGPDRTLSESVFAVNLVSAAESDLRPRVLPQLGQVSATRAPELTLLEFWKWPLALGIFVLLVEWWWYHRK